ncbi:hypothetical protein ACI65C_003277, partial [Semiaphis heraclei]
SRELLLAGRGLKYVVLVHANVARHYPQTLIETPAAPIFNHKHHLFQQCLTDNQLLIMDGLLP